MTDVYSLIFLPNNYKTQGRQRKYKSNTGAPSCNHPFPLKTNKYYIF